MKLTKKQQIEHKAKELFWKHGFRKVTIDEICKKANVSRKTFYTFYENKTALVIFIFNSEVERGYKVYEEIINSNLTFSEKITQLFEYKYKNTRDFSMEFVQDFFHPESGEMTEIFNEAIKRSMDFTRDFFQKAQENGYLNPELSLDYVMWLMQKSVEYCGTPEMLALFPNAESMSRQVSQSLIYGIMPVKK